jgi:hypothetical protein
LACPYREEEETLAQRMRKRARTSTDDETMVIEDETPTRIGSTSEPVVISPESGPRRSPQHSPLREFFICFPLAGAGEPIFVADIFGYAGEEQ